MIIVVLGADKHQCAAVSNEIHALLNSIEVGVNRGEGWPITQEQQNVVLDELRGKEVMLLSSLLPSKPAEEGG
jgi:hypothetical protein